MFWRDGIALVIITSFSHRASDAGHWVGVQRALDLQMGWVEDRGPGERERERERERKGGRREKEGGRERRQQG